MIRSNKVICEKQTFLAHICIIFKKVDYLYKIKKKLSIKVSSLNQIKDLLILAFY